MKRTIERVSLLLFMVSLIIVMFLCTPAFAEKTLSLSPGDICDVSECGKNTRIVISSAGDYTICGSSSNVWIDVCCGGVDLYLADGLKIDCGINANDVKTAPAIKIEENGGTVRLITKKNADVYLSGYLYSPAIQKEGVKTKLVFETENESFPGTITAYSDAASCSAGIGSVYHLLVDGSSCGNMVFNSGMIYATGGSDAAGIGGGSGKSMVRDIVINGGLIVAQGGNDGGAGIGGGMCGGIENITINGGVVEAYSRNGAGIGGGSSNSSGDGASGNGTITINGGKITARASWMGAGIGSGSKGDIESIIINGGDITAESELGCGIGSDGANFNGTCKSIEIKGGKITTVGGKGSGSPGIGSGLCGSGSTRISISGGDITVKGGKGKYSIGGGGKSTLFNSAHLYVDISGGTVNTVANDYKYAVGGEEGVTCTITGGALLIRDIKGTPTDGSGNEVIFATIEIDGMTAGNEITSAEISGLDRPYGFKDAKTMDGDGFETMLYCWLPIDSVVTSVTIDDTLCTGTFKTRYGAEPLAAQTKIILDANGGQSSGVATAARGSNNVVILKPPVWENYSINGYTLDNGHYVENWLITTGGKLLGNVSPYTDSDGKWLKTGGTVTVYPCWYWDPSPEPPKEFTYMIHFDGNYPEQHWGFSIENYGSMTDMTVHESQTSIQLKPCGWKLFMYEFIGWNTRPDGNGKVIPDGATITEHLTNENGATVRLYAQWALSNEVPDVPPQTGDTADPVLWSVIAGFSLTLLFVLLSKGRSGSINSR